MSSFDEVLQEIRWYDLTICLSAAILLLEIWLDTRQIKSLERMMNNQQSLQFIKYNPEAFKQNSKWNIARLQFSRIENLVGFVLEIIALYFGFLRVVYDCLSYFYVNILGLDKSHHIIFGVSFIFAVSGICTFVKTFFELYRLVFVDSSALKDNHTAESSSSEPSARAPSFLQLHLFLSAWSRDQFKSFLASVVFGIPVLCVIVALLSWEIRYQWLLTSFFVSTLSLLFTDFYADFLAPFYENITQLNQNNPKEEELKNQIQDLSNSLQFPLSEVHKVDTSKQFAHSNAYLLGYGRKKKIVLYDNLITQLTATEILAIIGHEIGHHKYYHTWKKLFVQMVFIGNFIFVFSHVIRLQAFYTSFGFDRPDVSVGLVIFAYMYSSFGSLMRFVTNTVSRSFEFKADKYAINHGLAMERALIKLHVMHNIANIMPDHIYSIYHYSHPSLLERLEAMQQYRKKKS